MTWQLRTARLIAAAAAEGAGEVWAFGSVATGDVDEWSDLDVALVGASAEGVGPDWFAFLGPVWAFQREGRTTRVVLADGRRVDLVVVPDLASVPGEAQLRIEPSGSVPPGERSAEVPAIVNQFRFLAAQSLAKVERDDLLIGAHLALELPRLCLVVAMLLRDRDEGGTMHRFGGPRNETFERVRALTADLPPGALGVVELVRGARALFDELATDYWPAYAPDWSGLRFRPPGRSRTASSRPPAP